MTQRFTEDDVVTHVTRLTRTRLVRFVEGAFVRPDDDGSFRAVDIARLELLCDLSEDLELDETALGVVISLIDQLHGARRDLVALVAALDSLPADTRASLLAKIGQS